MRHWLDLQLLYTAVDRARTLDLKTDLVHYTVGLLMCVSLTKFMGAVPLYSCFLVRTFASISDSWFLWVTSSV